MCALLLVLVLPGVGYFEVWLLVTGELCVVKSPGKAALRETLTAFVLATTEYYHVENVLVQPVGKRQCGLSSLNSEVFKVELIQKNLGEKSCFGFTLQVQQG